MSLRLEDIELMIEELQAILKYERLLEEKKKQVIENINKACKIN